MTPTSGATPWQGNSQPLSGGNPFAGFGGQSQPAAPPPPVPQPAPRTAPGGTARTPPPNVNEITALSGSPPPSAGDTRDDLLRKAAALFRANQHEMALELLEKIAREFPPIDDTLRGYLDATRAAVLNALRGKARMDQVPRPRMQPNQLMQLKLTPEAGFLLSRIDGMSTLEDILAISGIEELTALRALSVLVQSGAIELA